MKIIESKMGLQGTEIVFKFACACALKILSVELVDLGSECLGDPAFIRFLVSGRTTA